MNDIQKSMKYSLIYGLVGAVLLPLIYECYANISRNVAMVLIGAWAVYAGIKFSRLKAKAALLGITAALAYSGILGLICYVIIHPAAVSFLEKHSSYFYLTLKEQASFVIYAALVMLLMYVVCLAKYGIFRAINLIRGNGEKAAGYIDNAFSDEDGEKL